LSILIELTLRGSVAVLLVGLLDRAFAGRISGSSRRLWWCFLPVAFLAPIRVPLLPTLGNLPSAGLPGWPSRLELPAPGPGAAGMAAGPAGLVLFLWLLGAAAYLLVVVVQTIRASRRWSGEPLATDAALLGLLESCKAEAGVTAPLSLVVSKSISSPAIMGWVRPRILLPPAFAEPAQADVLRPIFLHELAHFRWGDVPFSWILTLVRALHWFNPLAHLGAVWWTRFREEAADEAALGWMPGRASSAYGEALVHSLRQSRAASLPFGSLGIAESVRNLKRRLYMINRYNDKSPRAPLTALVALALAALIGSVSSRAADAASADPKAVAVAVSSTWLKLVDDGDYQAAYDSTGSWYHSLVGALEWIGWRVKYASRDGRLVERHLAKEVRFESVPDGKFAGEWAYVEFASAFARNPSMTQLVVLKKEAGGTWKVAGDSLGDRKP
jgi:beta-lactamase regulating signal transducer with metallopeptidase domain